MNSELIKILETTDGTTQAEILKSLKNRIRWSTNRFAERHCELENKCQICGEKEGIQFHHNDYSKPFMVNQLCNKCHCCICLSRKSFPITIFPSRPAHIQEYHRVGNLANYK